MSLFYYCAPKYIIWCIHYSHYILTNESFNDNIPTNINLLSYIETVNILFDDNISSYGLYYRANNNEMQDEVE